MHSSRKRKKESNSHCLGNTQTIPRKKRYKKVNRADIFMSITNCYIFVIRMLSIQSINIWEAQENQMNILFYLVHAGRPPDSACSAGEMSKNAELRGNLLKHGRHFSAYASMSSSDRKSS